MSKENFLCTPVINKHGLKCPVPAEFWPDSAYYATIFRAGNNVFVEFWEYKPTLVDSDTWFVDNDSYDDFRITSLVLRDFTDFPNPDEKCIWEK